jgi:transcriptional regulator with XRE-family HTH domain
MSLNALGDTIRSSREKRNIGLRQLARKIGISPTFISRIEHGKLPTPPSEAVLKLIAETLTLDFDRLMFQAGRIPNDVAEFILNDPTMVCFLRDAIARRLTGEALMKFLSDD